MFRKIVIFGVVLLIVLFVVYKYAYKPHRDIAYEEAEYSTSVEKLYSEFSVNDSLANAKYLDKTIVVKGLVSSVDEKYNTITIENKIIARFLNKITRTFNTSDSIVIKGRLVGYDDLLEEIQLDQCSFE